MSLDSPEISTESAAAAPAVAASQMVHGVAMAWGKPWYTSKTLWFNALVLALVVFESQMHLLQPYMPGNVYAYISVFLAVGNKVLRLLTVTGIQGAARLPPLDGIAVDVTSAVPPLDDGSSKGG